jgi:hypothetical protein
MFRWGNSVILADAIPLAMATTCTNWQHSKLN